jgi:hypothetical protein
MMFFKKILEVHGFIGVKSNTKRFFKTCFSNFEPFLANRVLKFQKMLISPKNFFFTKFEYGYQNNSEFYADLESVGKNAKNLLTKKLQAKKCAKL